MESWKKKYNCVIIYVAVKHKILRSFEKCLSGVQNNTNFYCLYKKQTNILFLNMFFYVTQNKESHIGLIKWLWQNYAFKLCQMQHFKENIIVSKCHRV